MASPTRSALRGRMPAVLAALAALLLASPAFALRVVDWNILNYPGSSGPARAAYYRTILDTLSLNADVIVTEEQADAEAGAAEFLNEVLNTMDPPGTWAMTPFIDGNDTDAELYYRVATVQFLGQWAFYPNPSYHLRYIHVYRLKPVGYTSADAEFRIYAGHLKASDTSDDRTTRRLECTGLRDSMNAMPSGTRALVCGDMNFYRASTDTGYTRLTESQANNIGRIYDMLPAGSWHDGSTFAPYHTQSPCLNGTCASGAATGGLDDRFDMVLPTYSMVTGQGLSAITGTMIPIGNDGQHLNKNITDSPTIPEGANFATALKLASDHLPVRVDLQVPAKISTDATLDFGTVIVDAPIQSKDLSVSNPAAVPGDSLNCTFAAPPCFNGPGPLAVAAGSSAFATVTMCTDVVGAKSGNLTITSDAPDNPTTYVALSGVVLDHSQPSLDSLVALVSDTLDFGEHAAGGFTPLLAAVHNLGYDALHAALVVGAADLTGGDGHFSIPGFAAANVEGTAARWQVLFDDAGATTDSTYEATLTFHSSDHAWPGAIARSDVSYLLRARVSGGTTAVGPTLPTITRLYKPVPNPLLSSSMLGFDLAHGTSARLEIFDLTGRRVAVLADREFAPGRYSLRWDGRGDAGAPAGPGLYFVRLTGRGLSTQTVRLAIVH